VQGLPQQPPPLCQTPASELLLVLRRRCERRWMRELLLLRRGLLLPNLLQLCRPSRNMMLPKDGHNQRS
jgi:hypothetical protein